MDGPSLTELFKVAGGLQGMQAEALTDAVLAWRGDRQLTEAGDSAYYARPDASYRPHGARFQALAELLMVRGVTADLFEKVEPHLTLFGSGKVNVNTAGVVVLEILGRRWAGSPPVARDLAERIVESRKRGGVFRKAGAGDLVRAIDEVLKLTPEEASLLKSMSRSMQCGAACFGGGVTAWTGGAARSGSADVAFVYDRRQRRFVYWHER
jgi:type II secretory pathway component PulK